MYFFLKFTLPGLLNPEIGVNILLRNAGTFTRRHLITSQEIHDDQKSLFTRRIQYNHQVHRDYLITLYIQGRAVTLVV